MSEWRFWKRQRKPSEEVQRIEGLLEESQQRLEAARKLSGKADRITKNLAAKNRRNGWGEVIAETMRRAER